MKRRASAVLRSPRLELSRRPSPRLRDVCPRPLSRALRALFHGRLAAREARPPACPLVGASSFPQSGSSVSRADTVRRDRSGTPYSSDTERAALAHASCKLSIRAIRKSPLPHTTAHYPKAPAQASRRSHHTSPSPGPPVTTPRTGTSCRTPASVRQTANRAGTRGHSRFGTASRRLRPRSSCDLGSRAGGRSRSTARIHGNPGTRPSGD